MPSPPAPRPKSLNAQIGEWGEQLVCQWLIQQQWQILEQRWHCRWGEVDIIAKSDTSNPQPKADTHRLAFVEVKTRRTQNWDANGLLAITPQKQQKLWKTARSYLSKHPTLAEFFCQFDVALVQCNLITQSQTTSTLSIPEALPPTIVNIQQPIRAGDYQLTLLDYIESAFTQ